jgi:hypothetical protein
MLASMAELDELSLDCEIEELDERTASAMTSPPSPAASAMEVPGANKSLMP